MEKVYTFTPLHEYKKNEEKDNKGIFIAKNSNFKLRSVYKEINKSVYIRNIDWDYFNNKK